MQTYLAIAAVALLILLVISRVILLRRLGIRAFGFGKMDKKDFLIPVCALPLLYLFLAHFFRWPRLGSALFRSGVVAWAGVGLCALGLALFAWALVSFGRSFRVGLDEDHPGPLVTSGAFALSRNPIYTAFGFVFLGVFLVYPNWILIVYFVAGAWLINRQVRLEEGSLRKIYGEEYEGYCKKVRRYL